MKSVVLLLAASAVLYGQPNTLTSKEAAEGWLLLFDGDSLFGWTPDGSAEWKVAGGAIVADSGNYGWLRHDTEFANFELRCDFRTAADGNSGVFLRSARAGAPHLTGYELQIFDGHPQYPTGSLVGHAAAKGAKIHPGEWQTLHVRAEGQHFVVMLDGATVLDARDGKSAVGHIGLQFNKDKKIEFRNVKLRPLGLRPLVDGSSKTGWHEVKPAKEPPSPAEWSVKDGIIHVEKGPGQFETDGVYQDFVLQADVRTNPKDENQHPNSGIFLRGTPKTWWSGYEVQIRNEYSDKDPSKVVDFGTGGIYHNQPARKIVARDGEYFAGTVVARGRSFSVWIDGYPVTSWTDTKAAGADVRKKEAVLHAGAISLQAHDPTTNLDFRNLRIATLPAGR